MESEGPAAALELHRFWDPDGPGRDLVSAVSKRALLALQWIAAFGFVLYGIYHIVSYFCMPYYFRDPLLLILGILCLLSGVMLCGMPLYVTVTTLTFLLGMFLLLAGRRNCLGRATCVIFS